MYKSIEDIINQINGPLAPSGEETAAKYAVDAYQAPYNMLDQIEAHLDVLVDAGAEFDYQEAREWAIEVLFEELQEKNGKCRHDGVDLALAADAVMDNYGTCGEVRYYADAFDRNGAEYRVTWGTTQKWDDRSENPEEYESWLEDESNACDWDNPIEVEQITYGLDSSGNKSG